MPKFYLKFDSILYTWMTSTTTDSQQRTIMHVWRHRNRRTLFKTQIRMISHNLQIELGRHRRPHIPNEERLCTCGDIETEEHYLKQCNQYTHIRHKHGIHQNTELSHIMDCNTTYDYITELYNCREIYTQNTR